MGDATQLLTKSRLAAIVLSPDRDDLIARALAAAKGGIAVLALPISVPFVAEIAAEVADAADVAVGLSDVVLPEHLNLALAAGAEFVFSPIWGSISDRIGRRHMLLVTLTGTALSYVIWFFAGTFMLLIVARLVGGIMAGNISIASAAIADTHKGAERAKGMGILGAGIGLGFVVGPAIGGPCQAAEPRPAAERGGGGARPPPPLIPPNRDDIPRKWPHLRRIVLRRRSALPSPHPASYSWRSTINTCQNGQNPII